MKLEYIDNNIDMGVKYDYALIKKTIKKLKLYPKAKKGEETDVWNPLHVPFDSAKWFVFMSLRSKGKTTNFLLLGLIMHKLYGTVTQYITQTEQQLFPKHTKGLYNVIISNDYVPIITDGRWNSICLKARRWYYCNYDDSGKISEMSKDYFCIMVSIDKQETLKSIHNEPMGDLIIFDEFIHKYYMPNEFIELSQLISTIRRIRQSPIVIMISNTVNPYSTYFSELEISDEVLTMEAGDRKMITASGGTNVYVEIIDPKQTKQRIKSDRLFFGFKNPLLGAITGNTLWAVKNYPHIERNDKAETLARQYYIKYNNKLVNLELVKNELGLVVYCHKATKTYDDSIIYTLGEIRRPLDRYRFGNSKIDKIIWNLYSINKFYYATNDVGTLIENYINEAKMLK